METTTAPAPAVDSETESEDDYNPLREWNEKQLQSRPSHPLTHHTSDDVPVDEDSDTESDEDYNPIRDWNARMEKERTARLEPLNSANASEQAMTEPIASRPWLGMQH